MKKHMLNFRIYLIAWCLMLVAPVANATTYYVATTGDDTNPGTRAQPFRTIQWAVNAAAASDDILVADGTYNKHNVDFGAKALILQSQSNNPAACILDCRQQGKAFKLVEGKQPSAA